MEIVNTFEEYCVDTETKLEESSLEEHMRYFEAIKDEDGSFSYGEFEEAAPYDKQTVNNNLDTLVKQGLLEREVEDTETVYTDKMSMPGLESSRFYLTGASEDIIEDRDLDITGEQVGKVLGEA